METLLVWKKQILVAVVALAAALCMAVYAADDAEAHKHCGGTHYHNQYTATGVVTREWWVYKKETVSTWGTKRFYWKSRIVGSPFTTRNEGSILCG